MAERRSLPVVDLSGHLAGDHDATAVAAAQVCRALEELGFLSIVGHGVPWAQVLDIYGWAERYHRLPIEAKTDHPMGPATMGYLPLGGAQTGDLPALNAAFFMGRPGSKRNRFPVEGRLPGFADAVTDYYRVMDALGHQLLPLYAVAAGMPPDHFERYFQPALATLRMTHYPELPAADGQWSIDPHADAGFMTMLPSNPVAGLEIQDVDGSWFAVEQEPESFVVNAGDMLRRWTNDRFRSTRHRARNDTSGDRYAIPFFFDPRVDTIIEPLPTCVDDEHPSRYPPLRYGDHLTSFMNRGYAATRADATAAEPTGTGHGR
ncbi:MAG: 2OG-Fe(II) oxygenase family protein [Actinomycetota bacterium]